jgi:hypothetical protein
MKILITDDPAAPCQSSSCGLNGNITAGFLSFLSHLGAI